MIKKLQLQNFTAFQQAELSFGRGLNVLIGENSTGKTHILKLAYLFSKAWLDLVQNPNSHSLGKQRTEEYLARRIMGLFKAEKLGHLSHSSGDGKTIITAEVVGSIPTMHFIAPGEKPGEPLSEKMLWDIRFSRRAEKNISANRFPEDAAMNSYMGQSVYLPTKEIMSFFNGLRELSRKYDLQFDDTYLDFADNLALPPLKFPPELILKQQQELSKCIGGSVLLENGTFYIELGEKQKREISLVSEGLRKLATILRLINNGSLERGGTLYWDEPEANLNPRLIKLIARTLYILVQEGVQVILATHSLFLLRELEIIGNNSANKSLDRRFFALNKDGDNVVIEQGETLDEIDPIVMLDEALEQSDRFLNEV